MPAILLGLTDESSPGDSMDKDKKFVLKGLFVGLCLASPDQIILVPALPHIVPELGGIQLYA